MLARSYIRSHRPRQGLIFSKQAAPARRRCLMRNNHNRSAPPPTTPRTSNNASSTTPVSTNAAEEEALLFLAERGRAVGATLTLAERKLILKEVGLVNKDGTTNKLCRSDWEALVSRRSFADMEKLTLSDFLAMSHNDLFGQKLLQYTAMSGVAFFALAGSHTAGDAGFHVFGATLVGCITSLGGGTINGLLTGATPVSWVRNPTFLIITVCSSLLGFYGWPLAERMLETENPEDSITAEDEKGQSALRYGLESVALGALAVVGAQQGIIKGLHPFVSSALGVTIALGGVMRDLMCDRDLALGASTGCQSYGIASFSGAAVYVALRELHVWNCAGSTSKLLKGGIPIGVRILLGFGTVFSIRLAAWQNKPDGLLLTMEDSAEVNEKYLQRLVSFFTGKSSPAT
jgi:uncharacterized membrane protein YeiH